VPRRSEEAPYSKVERAFFEAIDRLDEGKPKHKTLQCGGLPNKRQKLKINMTTIALEAGYARTYLYKNPLPRVIARIEALIRPPKEIRTTKDLAEQLRAERNEALIDRDKAINAARKWMQHCFRLERRVKELEGQVTRLEKRGHVRNGAAH
jgi:hypothetical protein